MTPSVDLLLPSSAFLPLPPASRTEPPPSKCRVRPSRRMASTSASAATFNSSFSHLSPELLSLVFEQLRDIDRVSLHRLRLVSRRIDAIATPIAYRVLELNEALAQSDAKNRYPRLFDHIAAYTSHVIVRSDLDPEGIRRVLSVVRRLSSITWQYVEDELRAGDLWLPVDILDLGQMHSSRTKLYVENLPLREFGGQLANDYLRAIPPSLLVSLKLASSAPHLTTKLISLKKLLLRSSRLETFHYEDRGQGTSFEFGGVERLPAFADLVLQSYNWDHSTEVVRRHWDFSRIRSLELVSVPIFNFFSSVFFPDFSDLRTLRVDDFSAHLPDRRLDATRGLYSLVKSHIRALEELDISCHTKRFALDAVLQHRETLRVLRLRDHVGFGEEDRRCPTLGAADLAYLGRQLPHVHTLELDMDARMCDTPAFLRAISRFRSLHTLTLHVQTLIRSFEAVRLDTDQDYDAAMQTFRFLTQLRDQTNAELPWASITINVGGWRRVMVRRLSAAWKELNAKNIFAERCFVLERSPRARYSVREEMSAEALSRWPSPEL